MEIDEHEEIFEGDLTLKDFESTEIDLDDIDWDSVDDLTLDEVQLTFIPDENVEEVITSCGPPVGGKEIKKAKPQNFVCQQCGKK